MNFLQIIPEEDALLEIFGEEYNEYKKKLGGGFQPKDHYIYRKRAVRAQEKSLKENP